MLSKAKETIYDSLLALLFLIVATLFILMFEKKDNND